METKGGRLKVYVEPNAQPPGRSATYVNDLLSLVLTLSLWGGHPPPASEVVSQYLGVTQNITPGPYPEVLGIIFIHNHLSSLLLCVCVCGGGDLYFSP